MKKKFVLARCFLFCVFLFTCEIIALSPRVLITLSPECPFTVEELQRELNGSPVSGSDEEMKAKIKELDLPGENHLIILTKRFNGLKLFAKEIGYVHLHLKEIALDNLKNIISEIPKTNLDLPRNDPKIVGLFYDLAMKVDAIFKENQICYWATCGTLLGAVRHQGMIPWDDDIDFAIFEKDVETLLNLKEVLQSFGLGFAYHPKFQFYKIYPLDGEPIFHSSGVPFPWKFPFVDIFPIKEYQGKFTYAADIWQKIGLEKDYFTVEDLSFPLGELPFGPMSLPAPHFPLEYIKRLYGLDWNEVAYVSYSHRYEQFLPKVKVDLIDRSSLNIFYPIRPLA